MYIQIRSFLRIWSFSLKKSLMENSIFRAVLASLLHQFFKSLFITLLYDIV